MYSSLGHCCNEFIHECNKLLLSYCHACFFMPWHESPDAWIDWIVFFPTSVQLIEKTAGVFSFHSSSKLHFLSYIWHPIEPLVVFSVHIFFNMYLHVFCSLLRVMHYSKNVSIWKKERFAPVVRCRKSRLHNHLTLLKCDFSRYIAHVRLREEMFFLITWR